VALLQHDRQATAFFFCNQKGELISRSKFNVQLNEHLKKISSIIGKRLFPHSLRVSMVTKLLQHKSIQDGKSIIGHRDIRTTEVYNRNFPNEREYYQAMQHVYKVRNKRGLDKKRIGSGSTTTGNEIVGSAPLEKGNRIVAECPT
jgi:site-specific recombinase XerD